MTETARTYHVSDTPTIPGVYSVLVTINGVQHPKAHEPELFAYWDGVDTWHSWEFSVHAAMRAKASRGGWRPPWREVR